MTPNQLLNKIAQQIAQQTNNTAQPNNYPFTTTTIKTPNNKYFKLLYNHINNEIIVATKQNNNTYTKRIPLTDPNLLNRIEQLIERNTINTHKQDWKQHTW